MKDKDFLFRGLRERREEMVATKHRSGGWSGLRRAEEYFKQKKGDPSVREGRTENELSQVKILCQVLP